MKTLRVGVVNRFVAIFVLWGGLPFAETLHAAETLNPLDSVSCVFSFSPQVSSELAQEVAQVVDARLSRNCARWSNRVDDAFSESLLSRVRKAHSQAQILFWLGHTSNEMRRYILRLIYIPKNLQWSAGFSEVETPSRESSRELVRQAFASLPFVGFVTASGFVLWTESEPGPFRIVAFEEVNRHPFMPQILSVKREKDVEAKAHLRLAGEGRSELLLKPEVSLDPKRLLWLEKSL